MQDPVWSPRTSHSIPNATQPQVEQQQQKQQKVHVTKIGTGTSHTSEHNCASAIYFQASSEQVVEKCRFVYYHNHIPKPKYWKHKL